MLAIPGIYFELQRPWDYLPHLCSSGFGKMGEYPFGEHTSDSPGRPAKSVLTPKMRQIIMSAKRHTTCPTRNKIPKDSAYTRRVNREKVRSSSLSPSPSLSSPPSLGYRTGKAVQEEGPRPMWSLEVKTVSPTSPPPSLNTLCSSSWKRITPPGVLQLLLKGAGEGGEREENGQRSLM